MGSEAKNDMKGQSEHVLRVCNVKIRKCLPEAVGKIPWNLWVNSL